MVDMGLFPSLVQYYAKVILMHAPFPYWTWTVINVVTVRSEHIQEMLAVVALFWPCMERSKVFMHRECFFS